MSSFSAIMSSIGQKPQTGQQASSAGQKAPTSNDPRKPTPNGTKLTPTNTAAGIKRRSEEPDDGPKAKVVKPDQGGTNRTTSTTPSNRFQLSGKGDPPARPTAAPQRPPSRPASSSSPQKPTLSALSKPSTKPGTTSSPTPPTTTNGSAPPKRGFASIMERAKAAQEAAKASSSNVIKHKPVEKLSRKDKIQRMEEAKAQQKGVKRTKPGTSDRSRSNTPTAPRPGPVETSFKGTMKEKKKAEPLSYKGTMKAAAPGVKPEKHKTKGQAQDKYGGYASWSDLDDAEDEEDGYGSEGSSDMEGGWDDMEQEEQLALRAAKKEDLEALKEEEAHRKEKIDRKRRLEALSKSAAAKKRF